MKNDFDDLIRKGDDPAALLTLADELYKSGKIGGARKALLVRAAEKLREAAGERNRKNDTDGARRKDETDHLGQPGAYGGWAMRETPFRGGRRDGRIAGHLIDDGDRGLNGEKNVEVSGDCEFCNHSRLEIKLNGGESETCGNPCSKYFGREIHDDIYAFANNCELWDRIP